MKVDSGCGELPADFPAGDSGETDNALRVGAFDSAVERGYSAGNRLNAGVGYRYEPEVSR